MCLQIAVDLRKYSGFARHEFWGVAESFARSENVDNH